MDENDYVGNFGSLKVLRNYFDNPTKLLSDLVKFLNTSSFFPCNKLIFCIVIYLQTTKYNFFKICLEITLCGAFSIFFVLIWSRILDIVVPMNESRPHLAIPLMTAYFVDQEKYFYLILLHITAAICIGATAYIATGTMLVVYLKHTCGMFKIARYEKEYKSRH